MNLSNLETGYFAKENKRVTKVHITLGRLPVCNSRSTFTVHDFQFCAPGVKLDYLTCERCKKIGLQLLNTLKVTDEHRGTRKTSKVSK